MLRQKARPISELLNAYLRENGLETPLAEMHAVQAWNKATPAAVQKMTRSVEVRGTTMYVRISSPSLRANMMMDRTGLIRRINQIVGTEVIDKIVIQ